MDCTSACNPTHPLSQLSLTISWLSLKPKLLTSPAPDATKVKSVSPESKEQSNVDDYTNKASVDIADPNAIPPQDDKPTKNNVEIDLYIPGHIPGQEDLPASVTDAYSDVWG